MQEMIEHIQINATKFSMMNTYNMLKVIEPYLEKEKEQMFHSFYAGGGVNNNEDYEKEFNEYYNQTYNQNK